MDKNRKILFAAVIIAVIAVAVASTYLLLAYQPGQNSLLPSGEAPNGQILVTGDIATPATLTIQQLSKLPLVNVTVTIKGVAATYAGVTVLDALKQAGASWDAGPITAIGSDGYKKTINFYQAYNSTRYSGKQIILAFVENGKWIPTSDHGPLKLICPGLAPAYDVFSLAEINLQPWTIDITGTNYPIALTSSNMTNYGEPQTVQAVFAPGGQPQVTANWTGVSLWNILQAVGVPSGASTVMVTGIDGYSQQFTLAQVQSSGLLVGYKENGEHLTPNMGQPFRLICPTDSLKWGRYWVGWIAQITIS